LLVHIEPGLIEMMDRTLGELPPSPSLKNRLVAGGVAREVRSWENTSDHAPAWIELEDIALIRFQKKARD
jgi:hypothetical protein